MSFIDEINDTTRHAVLLSATGMRYVVCLSPPESKCWEYEDEQENIVMGTECQVALWLNDSDAESVTGEIFIDIEVDEWDDMGVTAHLKLL
jgi:hypothetical protein